MVESFKSFLADVSKEMKKVAWPTTEQLRESTVVVLVTCLLISGFVFLVDQAMTFVVKAIF
jgi:preprotein translocase subunit SecE